MYALGIDLGPGIIRKGNQEVYKDKIENTWDYLNVNRQKLLNEINLDQFKLIFNK
jgi:hypothetical protein